MYILLLAGLLFGTVDTTLVKGDEYAGFKGAVSITLDGKGNIYILDGEASEIIKLKEDLTELKRTSKKGWDNGQFDNPVSIDASSGLDIYVSDLNNGRIQRFDLNLAFISSLITNDESIEEKFKINRPSGSIIVNAKDLYVVDSDNPKIVIFKDGVYPYTYFGSFQSVNGSLTKPGKIIKDQNNFLYVIDFSRKGIMRYDNYGTFFGLLEVDEIKSVAVSNNYLYILTGKTIQIYDTKANAFKVIFDLPVEMRNRKFTDFLVINNKKIYLLEKTKVTNYIIK